MTATKGQDAVFSSEGRDGRKGSNRKIPWRTLRPLSEATNARSITTGAQIVSWPFSETALGKSGCAAATQTQGRSCPRNTRKGTKTKPTFVSLVCFVGKNRRRSEEQTCWSLCSNSPTETEKSRHRLC